MANGLLRSMPLHAITEMYGEAGLRELFGVQIAELPATHRATLERALALASKLHRHDRRVREPYVNHVLRVAIRIIRNYHVSDVDILVAALLHDSVEDHPIELAGGAPLDPRRAAVGVLARDFNPRVAELVDAVTNPEYDAGRDTHEQYREHIAEALDRSPWARVIKASDFTDNGVGVIHTTGPKVRRAATKYRPLVPIMRELVARPDTPLSDDVKRHIGEQFDLAEERFAAILRA